MADIYKQAKGLMEQILAPEEITAIAVYVEDPVQWWIDAIVNKANSRMSAIITERTEVNSSKLTTIQMRQEIGKLTLETAKDRNAREMAEFEAKTNINKKG